MLSRSKASLDPSDESLTASAPDIGWAGTDPAFGRRTNGFAGTPSTMPEQTPWYPYGSGMSGMPEAGVDFNEMMAMNNNIIYEAFGRDSVNDVYNLLTSQFSY
jgi:hypothetical protein